MHTGERAGLDANWPYSPQRGALAGKVEPGCAVVCYPDESSYFHRNVQNGDVRRGRGAAELDLTLYSLS